MAAQEAASLPHGHDGLGMDAGRFQNQPASAGMSTSTKIAIGARAVALLGC